MMAALTLVISPTITSASKDVDFQDIPAELVSVSSSTDSSPPSKKRKANKKGKRDNRSYRRINGEMRATVAVPFSSAHMNDEAITFFEGCVLTALEETIEEGLHARFVHVEEVEATGGSNNKKQAKKEKKQAKKEKKKAKKEKKKANKKNLRNTAAPSTSEPSFAPSSSPSDAAPEDPVDPEPQNEKEIVEDDPSSDPSSSSEDKYTYDPDKYSLYTLPGEDDLWFDIWSMITFECWSCDLFGEDDDDFYYPVISSSSSSEEATNTWLVDDDDDDYFAWRPTGTGRSHGQHRLLEDARDFSLTFQPRLCELLSEGPFEVFSGANDCHTFFVWN